MSSPTNAPPLSSSPRQVSLDRDASLTRYRSSSEDSNSAATARRSPTLTRAYNPMDPDARERQRTLDADMAIHLSRARQGSESVSPEASPLALREHIDREPETHPHHEESTFPGLSLHEERELEIARGEIPRQIHHIEDPYCRPLTPVDERPDLGMAHHLTQTHESHLFGSLRNVVNQFDGALPVYQPPILHSRQTFSFQAMEDFATEEKTRLGLSGSPDNRLQHLRVRKPSQMSVNGDVGPSSGSGTDFRLPAPHMGRERKLSQSIAVPRRHGGGKMALFEGIPGPGAPPASLAGGIAPPLSVVPSFADLPSPTGGGVGHDRPYRFSFYSNALSATIHARSLSELPADGQSFGDLFAGVGGPAPSPGGGPGPQTTPPFAREDIAQGENGGGTRKNLVETDPGSHIWNRGGTHKNLVETGSESHTWWLDVLSPTDEEMKMLSKVTSCIPGRCHLTN